jgi:Flp pilus assembly protein TadB
MNGTRGALIIGAIPIVVGIIYFLAQELFGTEAVLDPAGVLLLVCLGVAIGFGMLVILRGARDL